VPLPSSPRRSLALLWRPLATGPCLCLPWRSPPPLCTFYTALFTRLLPAVVAAVPGGPGGTPWVTGAAPGAVPGAVPASFLAEAGGGAFVLTTTTSTMNPGETRLLCTTETTKLANADQNTITSL